MANERIQMPSTSGGVVRYFDDYKSKVRIKPGYVVVLVLLVVVLSLLLHVFGRSIFSF